MDFSQFLLNESYNLSPYKLCVANFICSFMEYRNFLDSLPYDPKNLLTITGYGHLTYKLITSMDCSFEELNHMIDNADPPICSDVLDNFRNQITKLRRVEIKHFYDFFDKIRALVQKKMFKGRINIEPMDHFIPLTSYNQIHKMSLVGIYLRKLIIYYERLSYCETVTLFDQLQGYLSGNSDFEQHGHNRNSEENDEPFNETRFVPDPKIQELKSDIDLASLKELESRVSENSNSNLFFQHLSSLIRKIRFEIEIERKEPSLGGEESKDESVTEKAQSMETECSSNRPDSSSAMDMDITLNDSKEMSLDQTVFDHRTKEPETTNVEGVSCSKSLDSEKPVGDNSVKNRPGFDNSQYCWLKQIYKIQYNEKLAMSPQQVMRYIQSRFSQFNSFYYFRFIAFNYMANLNLARDYAALQVENKSSVANGVPSATADNHNISNTNITGQGPNSIQATSVNSSTNAIDTLNNKYQFLFRSINFFDDIEFLKYINALRVNNYTLAKKAFFDYFDLKKPGFEPETDATPASTSGGNSSIMNGVGNNLPNNNIQRPDGGHTGGGNAGAGTGHGHHHQDRNGSRSGVGDASGRVGADACSGATLSTNSANYCWSALNLAMMYAHFRYYRLAYDSLVDCLSLARDKRDERCLQYAMLWILQISQHLDHSQSTRGSKKKKKVYVDLDLMENIVGLILTNPVTMPYISAKAFLHFCRLQYLRPGPLVSEQMFLSDVMDTVHGNRSQRRSPLLPQSFFLAMKCRFYDVLGETFSTFSAILNAYGATHMASTYSQLWLRMDVIETVMDEQVFRLDENATIAVRNMAHYLYFARGDFFGACDLIQKFRRHYSLYNLKSQKMMERALIEIMFDRNVSTGQWNAATRCLNAIRCVDRTKSYLMLAELKRRQNQPLEALECLDLILGKQDRSHSLISKLSGSSFFHQENFRSCSQNSDEEEDQDQNESVVVRENIRTSQKMPDPISMSGDDQKSTIDSSKPIHLGNFESENLVFFERIQPPPPEELEPEEKRPLVPELDPYTALECYLMRGLIMEDLSILFECVALSLSYGFKQLECRALVQIARIQSEKFGQHNNGREIIQAVLHRVYSQGTLRDLATTLYVYAGTLYRMCLQRPVEANKHVNEIEHRTEMELAAKLAKRSVLVWQHIQDRQELANTFRLTALIYDALGEKNWRNFYAKRARIIRTTAARM